MPDPSADHDDDASQDPVTRPDYHGNGVDHAAHEAKPRKRRKLLRIVLVLVVLLALLISLAPTLLSTGPGTRWLVSIVNGKLPGELIIEDLSLSWFGGQRVEYITYAEMADASYVYIGKIEADEVGLFELLTGSRRLGEVILQDVELIAIAGCGESTEAEQPPVKDSAEEKTPFSLPAGLSGTLTIKNLVATYQPYRSEPIQLTLDHDEIKIADLRDITFELEGLLKQGDKEGRVSLKGDVLNLFDPDGVEQAEQAAYDITLDVQDVPVAVLDQAICGIRAATKPGQIVALLGEGELLAHASVNGTIDQLKSELTIQTPKIVVKLNQLAKDGKLIASPDSYAKIEMDQASFAALFPGSGLTLVEPTQIDLASLEMALPIVDKAVSWDKATASLLLKAGDNLAVVNERGEVLGIDDLRVVGGSESIAEELAFKLTTTLSAVDRASNVTREPVAVDVIVRSPMEQTREIDFFSKDLPIALADALAGQEGKLVLWLGETLALQADLNGKVTTDAQGNAQLEQQFSLRPEGQVTGTVSGVFAKGRLQVATPKDEPIEAVLSPQAFASLMEMLSGKPGEPALTIAQAMPVYVTLRDAERGPVSITTRQDKAGLKRFYPDPDQTSLGVTIELSPARVFDPKLKKTYELRGGSLSLSVPDLRGKAEVRAELDLWVRPDAGKEGVASLLTWATTVTDLLDTEGGLPLEGESLMQQLAATGAMQLENVPSGLMDTLLNRDGDLASILGPIVQNMDAGFTYKDGQPTGASVRLNWDEKNNQPMPDAWASMKPASFDIDAEQMLTVRGGEDLELEVRVNEDFGNRWMGKLHPILFDAKSGDRPVKIKIDGKSFRFSLQGDKMLGSRVEASVDLGTIQFGDDAMLGKLMQWSDRPGERAVFEPAIVKLVDGKISYDQFDLAVGKVKLRLDGEVDLASGQIVDMAVRVPGDSLIGVFNELDGVIKPDDFLSIPMSGAIRKPKFDSKLIGREVARLVTRGLLDQQKDKLKDLIRDGIGGDDKPKPDGEQPVPDDDAEPASDPAQDAADELIDRGLDLLFKRLGKNTKDAEQE